VRRAASVVVAALLAAGAAGCSSSGAASDSAPNPLDTGSITCGDLVSSGGELLNAFSTELVGQVAKASERTRAAGELQTILIAGCRQEPAGFHPAQPALRQFRAQYPAALR
jgi:hypothetical protein